MTLGENGYDACVGNICFNSERKVRVMKNGCSSKACLGILNGAVKYQDSSVLSPLQNSSFNVSSTQKL